MTGETEEPAGPRPHETVATGSTVAPARSDRKSRRCNPSPTIVRPESNPASCCGYGDSDVRFNDERHSTLPRRVCQAQQRHRPASRPHQRRACAAEGAGVCPGGARLPWEVVLGFITDHHDANGSSRSAAWCLAPSMYYVIALGSSRRSFSASGGETISTSRRPVCRGPQHNANPAENQSLRRLLNKLGFVRTGRQLSRN